MKVNIIMSMIKIINPSCFPSLSLALFVGWHTADIGAVCWLAHCRYWHCLFWPLDRWEFWPLRPVLFWPVDRWKFWPVRPVLFWPVDRWEFWSHFLRRHRLTKVERRCHWWTTNNRDFLLWCLFPSQLVRGRDLRAIGTKFYMWSPKFENIYNEMQMVRNITLNVNGWAKDNAVIGHGEQ